ncbi:extensin-like [Acanthaster planci]|uniref:Extensin-like n=1 Tax=Acanthaster planci TaxID=133434 RepID=A0A8B7ZB07_ACAPL|nr:extensin-like [Acanthaster planci]
MNPAYPPQPYHQPTGPPPPYSAPTNAGQPPPIGFNPNLYASPQPAYAPTSHYAAAAAPPVAQAAPPPAAYSAYSSAPPPAPAYITQAAVPYNASGAYNPNQPTYIHPPPQQPVSNLTVVQPTRTVYVANPGPSPGTSAGLGFLAGAALAGSHHHHHHHGFGHHGAFGHHHHHGFGHHGFGHHC